MRWYTWLIMDVLFYIIYPFIGGAILRYWISPNYIIFKT